MNNRSP